MSEILHWPPCPLCWAQRAFMYPIALYLPVAVYNRSTTLAKLALILSIIGGGIAFYHYIDAMSIFLPGPCAFANLMPCEVDPLMTRLRSSWLAIPLLALIAFVIIGVSMGVVLKSQVWAVIEEDDLPITPA